MKPFKCMISILFIASPAFADAAAAGAPTTGAGLAQFAPFIVIFVIFYFLLIRPQQRQAKQQKLMLEDLKRGDRVLTQGGIYGTIVAVKGKILEIKISENVKVFVAKSSVSELVPSDPAQEPETAAVVAKN